MVYQDFTQRVFTYHTNVFSDQTSVMFSTVSVIEYNHAPYMPLEKRREVVHR